MDAGEEVIDVTLVGDTLWAVLLRLPLPDLARAQLVCCAWRALIQDSSFLKTYCAVRGWEWRAFLERLERKEAARVLRDAARGYVKRKRLARCLTCVDGVLTPSVWLYARKMFLRDCKRASRSQPGSALLKDAALRARFDSMLQFLSHILSLHPQNPLALNRRALLLSDDGRFSEAIVDLEACVALRPYFADALHNLALCYHETGRLADSLRCYTRAILLEGDVVSINNRGLLFNDMRRNHDAIADFTTIIEQLNARYIDAWNNIAFAYNCVGRYQDAERCATRALDLKPRLAEPHRIRAYSYFKQERFEEAVADCDAAMSKYGQDRVYAKAHYTRGLALQAIASRLGDDEGARRSAVLVAAKADLDLALERCPTVADDL